MAVCDHSSTSARHEFLLYNCCVELAFCGVRCVFRSASVLCAARGPRSKVPVGASFPRAQLAAASWKSGRRDRLISSNCSRPLKVIPKRLRRIHLSTRTSTSKSATARTASKSRTARIHAVHALMHAPTRAPKRFTYSDLLIAISFFHLKRAASRRRTRHGENRSGCLHPDIFRSECWPRQGFS